jgi:ABC-type transport system involved in cytochrome c biogenesis permease subunit
MGYAAGLLAAIIAHVYIFARIFGCRDRELLRDITRMVYAVMCFTLLFSLVGTILGGIWANVSWGRFWGWDPKENGALLIVLATLAILHARMGGHIRQDGVHLCAIVLGMIVAFSWWYVNVMGVGLHSYGFTSGIKRAVWKFWQVELVVLVIGFASRKWCWNSWRGLGRPSSEQ